MRTAFDTHCSGDGVTQSRLYDSCLVTGKVSSGDVVAVEVRDEKVRARGVCGIDVCVSRKAGDEVWILVKRGKSKGLEWRREGFALRSEHAGSGKSSWRMS